MRSRSSKIQWNAKTNRIIKISQSATHFCELCWTDIVPGEKYRGGTIVKAHTVCVDRLIPMAV